MSHCGTFSNLVKSNNSISVCWEIPETQFFSTKNAYSSWLSTDDAPITWQFCCIEMFGNAQPHKMIQVSGENVADTHYGILCTLNFMKPGNTAAMENMEIRKLCRFAAKRRTETAIGIYSIDELKNQITDGNLPIQIILEPLRPNFVQEKTYHGQCTKNTCDHKILETLLTSKKFNDFVIKVEGQEIAVHKCILALRSSVLCAMLENCCSESNLGCMEITDVDKDTMFSFVRFLYTNNVTISTVSQAEKLFTVSDKYNVQDLKLLCQNWILNNINVSNVVDILIFADYHNADNIKSRATDYAAENSKGIDHSQFETLLEKAPHLTLILMKKLALK